MSMLDDFIQRCKQFPSPVALELGTKRSQAGRSTKHDYWVPHAREYICTDIAEGLDVDVVADVHQIADVLGDEQFDVIISCSTFEHLKYPHLAAHQIMRLLRKKGLLYIQTHHTFPLHGFPYDYFRFSREALAGLFGQKMGFNVIGTTYEFPAIIYSDREPGTQNHPSFLNTCLFGEKTSKTPKRYIHELQYP